MSFGLSLGILLAIAIALTLALTPTGAAADHGGPHPVVDGFVQDPVTGVVEEAYVVQGITYTQDQLTGDFAGLLYTAEDATNFYFGFAQSVFINDNTYSDGNKNDPNNPEIGWDSIGRSHRIQDLLQSEHIEVQIFSTPDNTGVPVLDFFLDYASDDVNGQNVGNIDSLGPIGGDGFFITGTVADLPEWASSLDWNINVASPTFSDNPNSSPRRILTNSYDPGTTADPNSPWIYETVYEWSVAKSAFPQANPTLDDISISILEVHNSPVKAGNPVPIPVINVKKESNPPSGSDVVGGQLITYTVTVENTGLVPITGMVITDVPDSNLTNIVPLDGGGFAGGTITWPSTGTLPTLAVGATLTVQFQANVISPTAVGTDIFNTGTISADQLPTPAQTNTTVHTVTGNPVIAVVKTPDINDAPQPLTRAAGETVDFIYLVTNGGNVDLENVVLTDNLEGTPAFVGGDTGLDGILSVGETWTYGATHTVTQAEIDAGVIGTNVDGESGTATVTGVGVGTTGLVSATDPGGVTLLQTPGIAVTKVADVTAFSAPGTATYTYTVNNTGNVTLTNIVVTDDNATPGNAADDFNVTLLATTLAPGASTSGTATHSVTQAEIDSGAAIVNVASADSDQAGPETATETLSITQTPGIAVTKVADVTVFSAPGTATYTYTVNNTGNVTLTNIVVTDDNATPGNAADDFGVTLLATTLAPGASTSGTATHSVTQAEIDSGAAIVNVASADSDQAGPETATETLSITQTPGIAVTKVADVTVFSAPGTATYTYTVNNTGNVTLTNIVVTDDNATPGNAADDFNVTLLATTLAPGASTSGTATHSVTQAEIDSGAAIMNVASADSDQAGPETATETLSITQNPLVQVTKSAAIAEVTRTISNAATVVTNEGATDDNLLNNPIDSLVIVAHDITYTITVINTGNVTLNNATLSDDVPAGTTFTSATSTQGTCADPDANGTVTCNLGTIDVGGNSTDVTVTLIVRTTTP